MTMIDIREYLDRHRQSPFREWRGKLNPEARRKVTTALYRVGLGNFSNVKGVSAGVFECKINFGPAIAFILGRTASSLSSSLAVAQNNANRTISAWPSADGKTTSRGRSSRKKKKRNEHGLDA